MLGDRVTALEAGIIAERQERNRFERRLEEERRERKDLEKRFDNQIRALALSTQVSSQADHELELMRAQFEAAADATQNQLDDHKDSLNCIMEILEDTVTADQTQHMLGEMAGRIDLRIAELDGLAGLGGGGQPALSDVGAEKLNAEVSETRQRLDLVVDEVTVLERQLNLRMETCEHVTTSAANASKDMGANTGFVLLIAVVAVVVAGEWCLWRRPH